MNSICLRNFLGVLAATLAVGCATMAVGCATMAAGSASSPFGPEFAPIAELSPEYAAKADRSYNFVDKGQNGEEFRAAYGGYDYQCDGRPQEYFEFADPNPTGAPQLTSNPEAAYRKQFKAEFFPEEMLKTFSDRSKASGDDAITKMRRLEPDAWPPFGLADYIAYDDGWLIAYDIGEFGGALIWLPKEGDSEIIRDGPTNDLLQVGDLVYVAQGVDHLGPGRGSVSAFRRGTRYVSSDMVDGEVALEMRNSWVISEFEYVAGSAVIKIAYRDGLLVGLTNLGLFVVGSDGVVRYNLPQYREERISKIGDNGYQQKTVDASKIVQRAQDIAIDDSGRVYVAGVDMVGVYEGLPNDLTPILYAKKDCEFDYGLADDGSF